MDITVNFQVLILLGLFGSLYGVDTIITCPINGGVHQHTCVCTPGIIDCEGHNFTTYPHFTSGGNYATIKLGNNSFKSVPSNSFASSQATEIVLSRNGISHIDSGAFASVYDRLTTLNLAHNSLTFLPNEIMSFTNLTDLDVSWNPIRGASPSSGHHHSTAGGLVDGVMRILGKNLVKFAFGSDTMTSWPTSLNHLNRLKELTVRGIRLPYWPAQCFHGFEQTLTSLTIDAAYLDSVPLGISFLLNLEKLHLDHLNVSPNFGDDSLISAPFSTLSSTLKELSLTYDGLTTFPEGIKDLRILANLTLDGNDLQFVSDEAISLLDNANVSYLSLKDCNLKRIPGAISNLRKLKTLDLSNNKIRSIESSDLQHLSGLIILTLNLNPLIYISDNFSCGLTSLTTFNLRYTNLTKISQSFKNLVTLETLDLTKSNIDCTCDLTWLHYWRNTCTRGTGAVSLLGDCETIEQDIMSYVDDRLKTCPGFGPDKLAFRCTKGCT